MFKDLSITIKGHWGVSVIETTGDPVFDQLTTIQYKLPANSRGIAKATYVCPITREKKEWPTKEDGKLVPLSELGF